MQLEHCWYIKTHHSACALILYRWPIFPTPYIALSIGKLYQYIPGFIPQAMYRWGVRVPLFERFVLGRDLDAPVITWPMTTMTSTPMRCSWTNRPAPSIFLTVSYIQRMNIHLGAWSGNSYMDSSPKISALGQLGLGFLALQYWSCTPNPREEADPQSVSWIMLPTMPS